MKQTIADLTSDLAGCRLHLASMRENGRKIMDDHTNRTIECVEAVDLFKTTIIMIKTNLSLTPEINMSNYNSDDVEETNNALTTISLLVDERHPDLEPVGG